MSYPADLVEQARHLAGREKNKPRQASLRRAVSTAYYAIFHLLIEEATLNWKFSDQRGRDTANCLRHLEEVARSFVMFQQQRHIADYDSSRKWTRFDVLSMVDQAESSFQAWKQIRRHPAAQAFLASLLGAPRTS